MTRIVSRRYCSAVAVVKSPLICLTEAGESVGGEKVGEQTLLDAVRDVGHVLHAPHRVGDRGERDNRANVVAEDLLQPTDAGVVVGSTWPHQSTENRVEARSEERRVGKRCRNRWVPERS